MKIVIAKLNLIAVESAKNEYMTICKFNFKFFDKKKSNIEI